MLTYIKENRAIVKFLTIALFLYLMWYIIYDRVFHSITQVNVLLIESQTYISAHFYKLIGYEVSYEYQNNRHMGVIELNNQRSLGIAPACDSLEVMVVYLIFIVAYFNKLKTKLLFVIIGPALIYVINVIRIICLLYIGLNWPQYLDFNHKYVFVMIVYSFVFFLWYKYINTSGSRFFK